MKNTLTIGIAAYNEAKNIDFLLKEILIQSFNGYTLSKIIVISDGSSDETVRIARSVVDSRIRVVDSKKRLGKSARLNEIIKRTDTDYLILLDADISISDKFFLKKLIQPIAKGRASMTSAALQEMTPRKFFEQILFVSMHLKSILFQEFKKGNNVYNCHGPARAFSRSFYNTLTFEKFTGDDMFSYLACIKSGKKFAYVADTSVAYRLPSNPSDHYKQSSRYLETRENNGKFFGRDFVESELSIPNEVYLRGALKALPYILSNLILVTAYLFVLTSVHIGAFFKVKAKENWNVTSSKQLN